jgi:hypothetical protein
VSVKYPLLWDIQIFVPFDCTVGARVDYFALPFGLYGIYDHDPIFSLKNCATLASFNTGCIVALIARSHQVSCINHWRLTTHTT